MHGLNKFRILVVILILSTGTLVADGTRISPPKNRYAPADDVKLGQEAAEQVRREMPLLPENGDVDSYVERVGQVLSSAIPPEFARSEFRYDFSVVNASDINAFALPGGPMFVNRGMIEAAASEGEMAGVMAHELSHVALRHGTAQATKSQSAGVQLGALGGAILGAIIGGNAGDVIAQGSQAGLGVYLLKYSREYETQADILGAQILARAGYDPLDLARMFETISKQGGRGGPEWMSSHPDPGNRRDRIAEEAKLLRIASARPNRSADFSQAQSELRRMSPAQTMEQIAANTMGNDTGNRIPENTRVEQNVERPSTRYRAVTVNNFFQFSVPDNWQEFRGSSSITLAPRGAYGDYQGQSVFTHGAIVGVLDAGNYDLQRASDEYVAQVAAGNGYLQPESRYQRGRIDSREALRRRLSGKSPVTGRKEIVDVYTTMMNGNRLFYMVQVVPENEQRYYTRAFDEMTRTTNLAD